MSKKVYVLNGGSMYSQMYRNNGWEVTDDITEADLVHFTGGEDVSPSLYGQATHPTTYCSPSRDKQEAEVFQMCLELDIPMVGECRGGQFLNVMCGGEMYQHVDGHACQAGHMMVDVRTGDMFLTTSTHHQMMHPSSAGEILGVASESSVYEYMRGDVIERHLPRRGEDVEVVYYGTENALCFQGHPEYLTSEDECQMYFFNLIEEKLYAS